MKPPKFTPKAVTTTALTRRVNVAARHSRNLQFSSHAMQRATERDITLSDVIRVCRVGRVQGSVEWIEHRNEVKFTVVAQIRGVEIGVVAVMRVTQDGGIFVVTVMEIN